MFPDEETRGRSCVKKGDYGVNNFVVKIANSTSGLGKCYVMIGACGIHLQRNKGRDVGKWAIN